MPFYPAGLFPHWSRAIYDFYVSNYNDPLYVRDPPFFKLFVMIEIVLAVPLSLWGIRGIIQGVSTGPISSLILSRWAEHKSLLVVSFMKITAWFPCTSSPWWLILFYLLSSARWRRRTQRTGLKKILTRTYLDMLAISSSVCTEPLPLPCLLTGSTEGNLLAMTMWVDMFSRPKTPLAEKSKINWEKRQNVFLISFTVLSLIGGQANFVAS